MDGDNGQPHLSPPIQPSPAPETANLSDGSQKELEDHVMSEIHLGCPPKFSGSFVSHFTFSLPPDVEYIGSKYEYEVLDDSKQHQEVSLDDDGDLALPRCSKHSKDKFVVAIQHNITSSIPKVGLQNLVLVQPDIRDDLTTPQINWLNAKYESSRKCKCLCMVNVDACSWCHSHSRRTAKISCRCHLSSAAQRRSIIPFRNLMEHSGLVGMLLARVAKTVFLTDHGVEILENCARNLHLNSAMLPSKTSVYVRELDWKASWPPKQGNCASCQSYAWNLSEFEELERASLLVAADVIYSDDLTDALFSTLEILMLHGLKKVLYLALEKRYNFSLDDLDVVANGYSCFRSYVRDGSDDAEHNELQNGSLCAFVGTRIDLTEIPQYANNYDRGHDVELWQIKYAREEENL